ncbi:MAG: tripartite tricarboxylate transporter TctB family protein [Desulfococcus multivorans]|jgi:putative tricarboxylic transport membrane protein|nr:tripartite tricarboxylate transporter TctB family protein [Desulfococcus multivorans]
MKKGEIVTSAFCIAFFSFMLFQGFGLIEARRSGEVGSGFWPLMALVACLGLSIAWLVGTIAESRKAGEKPAAGPSAEDPAAAWERRKKVGLSMICLFLYIVAMPWIGFVLSTFLFVFAFAFSLGERRKGVLAVSPFLVTAMIVAVFAKFITIPFPRGVGVFAAFSRLFYQ